MKQFQIMLSKEFALNAWFRQIRDYCDKNAVPAEAMIFRIYSDTIRTDLVRSVLSKLEACFPGTAYAGTSSGGNIIYGSLMDVHLSLTCTIFEEPDSWVKVLQYPMTEDTQEASTDAFLKEAADCAGLKAVEVMTTLGRMDKRRFCRQLSRLGEAVKVYGGGANAADIVNGNFQNTYVFSSAGKIEPFQAVFVLLGGPALHVDTRYLIGWEKIGKPFQVTAARKNLLLELNHRPAWEVYEQYLQIPETNFFHLANIFPLLFESAGTPYLRIITAHLTDGSLRLGAFVDEEASCSIAYGDPVAILDSMKRQLEVISTFSPQIIQLFSCAARKYYWGDEAVSQETLPFEGIASTSGYYTSGEFLRTNREVLMHNATLVITAMREGEAVRKSWTPEIQQIELTRQMQVSRCLAAFINAQSQIKSE